MAQARHAPQLPEGGLAAGEACGRTGSNSGAAEGALLARGTRRRQSLAGERVELAAALVEVPMGQTQGIGGLLAAVALQEPEQQGRQILLAPGARRPAAWGLERAQQVAQAATDPAVRNGTCGRGKRYAILTSEMDIY